MKRVLLVSAEPWEVAYVPSRADVQWRKAANGPGPCLAAAALAHVPAKEVDAVVSAGTCGALDSRLHVGDVVAGTAVNGQAVLEPVSCRSFFKGSFACDDLVVGTREAKRTLAATGAIAVDMESATIAQWARERGVPCYVIRAVSDTAEESFALDLNGARDAEGRFSTVKILLQAAKRPTAIVPELWRFQRNARVAAKALGEFLGDCDFR